MFGAASTAEDVTAQWGHLIVDKNVLVTGASSGIGAESSRVFALAGANVWLAGRDVAKTAAVANEIAKVVDPSKVHVIALDLSSISSVRACVDEFLSLYVPLDVLLNNAGCMAVQEKILTADNLEMQIGTNFFGHFALTQGLLPRLRAGSRIVNVSSMAHFRSPILFDDIHFSSTEYDAVSPPLFKSAFFCVD